LKKWSVPPEWKGETGFLIGGGPSLLGQEVSLLRGSRVVALNSSWEVAPFADFLLFGDPRWWRWHGEEVRRNFPGRVVSISYARDERLLNLDRAALVNGRIGPLTKDNCNQLVFRRTIAASGLHMLALLGVRKIITLGLDGRLGNSGRSHHHEPHPIKLRPDTFEQQIIDFESAAHDLDRLGIEVLNASPGSAIDLWPIVSLREALEPHCVSRKNTLGINESTLLPA